MGYVAFRDILSYTDCVYNYTSKGSAIEMNLSTKEFENKITSAKNIEELRAVLESLPKESFENRFVDLCIKYNLTNSQVQTASGINKSLFYAFFEKKNPKRARKPQKHHIIRMGLAMGASVEEINELLKLGKHKELYAKNKDDAIIIFGINNKLDINAIEELLIDAGATLSLHDKHDQ